MSTTENEGKLEITTGDALAIIVITEIITIIYMAWRISKEDSLNQIVVDSGAAIPLFTIIATVLFQTGDVVMWLTRRYKRRIKAEGKAEGKAEVYRELEEWEKRKKETEARGEKFTEPLPISKTIERC